MYDVVGVLIRGVSFTFSREFILLYTSNDKRIISKEKEIKIKLNVLLINLFIKVYFIYDF